MIFPKPWKGVMCVSCWWLNRESWLMSWCLSSWRLCWDQTLSHQTTMYFLFSSAFVFLTYLPYYQFVGPLAVSGRFVPGVIHCKTFSSASSLSFESASSVLTGEKGFCIYLIEFLFFCHLGGWLQLSSTVENVFHVPPVAYFFLNCRCFGFISL